MEPKQHTKSPEAPRHFIGGTTGRGRNSGLDYKSRTAPPRMDGKK